MGKICSKCHIDKELDEFHKFKYSKDGVKSVCKLCISIINKIPKNKIKKNNYGRIWRENNKEKVRDYKLKEYEKNKELILLRNAEWRLKNPDKYKKDLIQGQDAGSSNSQELEKQIKTKLKDDINRLVQNFNPDAFSETTPDAKYTSYSVNKGEKIVFCLRDKKDGEELVKENIMTFVAIHELGHLMTKSIGHEPEFWNTFKLLLKIAIDNGLYKNIDFNSTPKEYCGVKITDTPLKLT